MSGSADVEQPSPVVLYWRPACVFCVVLRRRLRWKGVVPEEHNIWNEPEAAAFVRSVTGGDETVPTVVVGDRALVNPTVAEVLALLGHEREPGGLRARFRRLIAPGR